MRVIEQLVSYLSKKELLSSLDVEWLQEQGVIPRDEYDDYEQSESYDDNHDWQGEFDELYELQDDLAKRWESSRLSSNRTRARRRKTRSSVSAATGHQEQIAESSTISSLVRSLSAVESEVRIAAATILGLIGRVNPGKAIPGLAIALDDPIEHVALVVAAALLSISSLNTDIRRKSQMTLLIGLESEAADVRNKAINAMLQIPVESSGFALPFLARRLRDQELVICDLANSMMNYWRRKVENDGAIAMLETHCIVWQQIQGQSKENFVKTIIENVFIGLRKDLHREDAFLRISVAQLLLAIDSSLATEVLPVLVEGVASTESSVCRHSLRIIGLLEVECVERLTRPIISRLSNPDWSIRQEAAKALSRIGSRAIDATAELAELLNDPVEDVRIDAIVALGLIGDDQIYKSLLKLLYDHSPRIRMAAATSLSTIRPVASNAFPFLCHLIEHDFHPSVRKSAIDAAMEIGRLDKRLSKHSRLILALTICERQANAELKKVAVEAKQRLKNR